jgi:hypothetical protein
MRDRLPLFFGIFVVMALSNAIVPVLPAFGEGTIHHGAIYSAYFLGAFLLDLPAGFLSDRIGELPLIRAGLVLTVISGFLLLVSHTLPLVIASRLIEGVGAGLFVASALSLINARTDHETSSGYFMALLNVGLVAGLIGGGWLVELTGDRFSGILLFSVLALIPAAGSILMRSGAVSAAAFPLEPVMETVRRLIRVLREYFWLWISTIVILGATGALTVLYPEFSDLAPGRLAVIIAAMNLSTAIAVVIAAHAHLPPVPTIRVASLVMAVAVLCAYVTPFGFIFVGAVAGLVMIGQLAFLAMAEARQGVLMGLFNTASYGGMTLIPFVAGYVAAVSTFFVAFVLVSLSAVFVAATIGRCGCRISRS